MKTIICILSTAFFLFACTQEKKNPIEGNWKLIFMQEFSGDTLKWDLNKNYTGSDMKMWSESHFIFVGKFKEETAEINSYGGGTYTLDGNQYHENILYHNIPSFVGKTLKFTLEIKNDTLIQTGPFNDQWQIEKSNHFIEKYIRLD